MILLTRINGGTIGLNVDLIERLDVTPDTVLTLVDGKKYLVAEGALEVVERVISFRARVLVEAEAITRGEGRGNLAPLRLISESPAED